MEQDVEVALDIQRGGRMYERYRDVPEHTFSYTTNITHCTAVQIIPTTFVLLERQVILELLAFAEVTRADSCSRHFTNYQACDE